MSKPSGNMPAAKINLKNTLWDIASQWKAMIIVALVIALLTVGYKYVSDTKAYQAQLDSKNRAEETANLPVETQINNILEALPEDDVSAVEYMVQQKEWVKEEKDYINHSILMQENPTGQRTLLLYYYLKSEDPSEKVSASLAYGYATFTNSETIINGLREVINPELDNKYISELITAPNKGEYIRAEEDGDVVLETRIVLPESTDASSVEKVITDALNEYSTELRKTIGPHTISFMRSTEARLFNSDIASRRNTIIANVYSTETYIKNMEGSLSAEQKAAVESICSIKNTSDNLSEIDATADNSKEEPPKPGFRIKYIIFGFILGLLLYVGLYLGVLVFKGSVTSADTLAFYTDSRLLGEVYYSENVSGIKKLLHSKLINKIRNRGNSSMTSQIDRVAARIGSVCNHLEINNVTILNMADSDDACDEILRKICAAIKEQNIIADIINASDEVNEKDLLPVNHAVMIIKRGTKLSKLWTLAELCRSYDINQLGNVYVAKQ